MFASRALTRREKILLLVLALVGVVGLYFCLVHYPIAERTDEIEAERAEIADKTVVAEVRSGIYKSMRSELDEIFKMPEDELTVMPKYDNIGVLMQYFNTIFADVAPEIQYDSVRTEDGVVLRTVRFTFTAKDYAEAKSVIDNLTGTGFRSLLSDLSFTPDEGDLEAGRVRVSGTAVFYEQAD